MTKLALGITGLVSVLVPACVEGPAQQPPGVASQAMSCGTADPVTAARLDGQLGGKLAGQLTGDQVACARAIVNTTRAYGLDQRAAEVAIATSIAKTSLENFTAGNSDSAGLFAQRVSQGWGLPDQLVDPEFATSALLDRMVVAFPDDAWQTQAVGAVAARIQSDAVADAIEAEAADAHVLASVLWTWQAETR